MRDYQEQWLEHAVIAELRRELAVERERAEKAETERDALIVKIHNLKGGIRLVQESCTEGMQL